MPTAFVIMQIGNPNLDAMYKEAIDPAIRACNLDPKRVDKHNEGGLLKSEIIEFIQRADIIVADLTNERPNCYLEIGYAMGLDKFRNIILTAREDHNQSSINHKLSGPKVHFDLIGYDILFWYPDKLQEFRMDLEKRIQRRRAIIAPQGNTIDQRSKEYQNWIDEHRKKAFEGLRNFGSEAFMELHFSIAGNRSNHNQQELLVAARRSQIDTFGWPIGIVLNMDEGAPHPTPEGIVTEVTGSLSLGSYDYWTIRRDASFFLVKSLFEDMRAKAQIFQNTRIIRVTESFLYCARLYSNLGYPSNTSLSIWVRHGGLKGRILTRSGGDPRFRAKLNAATEEVATHIETSISGIEFNLVDLVMKVCGELFIVFDYASLSPDEYRRIVDGFVAGRTP